MKDVKKLVLFFSLAVYVTLSLVYSNKQGFWHDEIHTLTFLKGSSAYDFEGSPMHNVDSVFSVSTYKILLAKDNFIDNFNLQIQHEGHPPVYFILLKVWSIIFGYSEIALRSFSILSGLIFLLVLYSIIKFKSKSASIATVIIIITLFNPFLFYFFSEARMYALALLFAILSFKYWIQYINSTDRRFAYYAWYVLSATALLYTHYYGIFFLTTLIYFEIIKNGFTKNILKSLLPFLLFTPWAIMIRKQLLFHSNHWTNGSYSLIESIGGFMNGISELLFSPVSSPLLIEQILTMTLLLTLIIILFKDKKGRLWIVGIAFYFFQVYLFDLLLDHHTIIIPRYYIFILIFIIWGVYKAFKGINKYLRIIALSFYLLVGGSSIYHIYMLNRAPKQMFRELSSYIDVNYNADNTLIVLETKGPLIFGISNYIQGNFDVVFASDYKPDKKYLNVIFVEEELGINYLYYNPSFNKEKLRVIHFVGINLYE